MVQETLLVFPIPRRLQKSENVSSTGREDLGFDVVEFQNASVLAVNGESVPSRAAKDSALTASDNRLQSNRDRSVVSVDFFTGQREPRDAAQASSMDASASTVAASSGPAAGGEGVVRSSAEFWRWSSSVNWRAPV